MARFYDTYSRDWKRREDTGQLTLFWPTFKGNVFMTLWTGSYYLFSGEFVEHRYLEKGRE